MRPQPVQFLFTFHFSEGKLKQKNKKLVITPEWRLLPRSHTHYIIPSYIVWEKITTETITLEPTTIHPSFQIILKTNMDFPLSMYSSRCISDCNSLKSILHVEKEFVRVNHVMIFMLVESAD